MAFLTLYDFVILQVQSNVTLSFFTWQVLLKI
jgi:hypothetical protein